MEEAANAFAGEIQPLSVPAGIGSCGAESGLFEPYEVWSPECVHLGRDVLIARGAVLSVIKEHNGVRYEPRLVIGDGTRIGRGLLVACVGSIEIGERVLISDRVFIGDAYHDYRDPSRAVLDQPMSPPRPVRIGDGAFLGVGVIILPGVTIGARSCVGGGAVVTADVAAGCVVAGNPARVIRHWDEAAGAWRDGPPDGPGRPRDRAAVTRAVALRARAAARGCAAALRTRAARRARAVRDRPS